MSERNVEIVRRGFRAFQKLDLDGFTADWRPDVVWDVRGYENWPGSKTEYQGTAEVLDEFAHYLGSARSFEVSGHDAVALDDTRVLGLHHERRVNEGEPAAVYLEIGTVYELDGDGKVTHVEVYTGHDKARGAAGLS
jgi:ketosteroid isomerase-like protein